jgi:hypothetical protein
MMDSLLADTDKEEALSRVYVQAVATGAGYVTSEMSLDRDGVDIGIRAGGGMRPAIDVQLKATVNLGDAKDGVFRFPLKVRNYDLLRISTIIPRILVVLKLPTDKSDWINLTPIELAIRNCAYWCSILGSDETENENTVTISIPEENVFDIDTLKALMAKARLGSLS